MLVIYHWRICKKSLQLSNFPTLFKTFEYGFLNKGIEPNNFKQEFTDRNILIHALKYLNETTFDQTTRIFPNINDDKQRKFIEAILIDSNFFDYKQAGYWKQFQLTSAANKSLFNESAEDLVDKYLGKTIKSEKRVSIENYKLASFKAFREDGNEIGDEVAWNNIAKKANIPQEMWEDMKNILIHQGYIRKTVATQQGDLVRANPNVVAAIYGLESRSSTLQVDQPFNEPKVNSTNSARNKVFVSYSHLDKKWLSEIKRHFKPFLNQIDFWDDSRITPGQKWKEEIRKAINETKVAILLVSVDFLGSDFIASHELPPLLSAAEEEGATILIIILRPCLFEDFPELNQFQTVNPPNKPVSRMNEDEREELFVDLVRVTKKVLNK